MERPSAPARRRYLKAIVCVTDGTVVRIRIVAPDGKREDDDRGCAAAPVGAPLTNDEIAEQLPALGLRMGRTPGGRDR
ncbi:hypothetical protein [Nocardiopsis sp. CC223A]|uniref:hypothetical protein n=1 Tax=Nocardiopsis sp. CC223A TaxID=3044051 RepID=UPI00278BEA77|nr:hypothetical protein [Nocardiopsis sp. CC223A]